MVWRQVRALIVARRGHHERAQQLAQEAVSLAKATDMLNFHGNALADLAEVYALSGHADEAREQLEQAIVLYDAEGQPRCCRESSPTGPGVQRPRRDLMS